LKIQNTGEKDIPIRFAKISAETKTPPSFTLTRGQVAEVPDVCWEVLKKQKRFERLLEKGDLKELGATKRSIPGDGDPDCEFCYGRGFITVDVISQIPDAAALKNPKNAKPLAGRRCRCVLARDVLSNVRRIWPGVDLMRAPRLEKPSELKKFVDKCVWITARDQEFKAHLRHVALRMGPRWFCRVRSDAQMMAGWLASAKAKSIQIFDVDVAETASKDMDLHDLADAPDLLVLLLGVKRARNSATPETLMEVIAIREFLDKPTWIVDQPNYPVDHDAHRCNSPEIMTKLGDSFTRVLLNSGAMVAHSSPDDILDTGTQATTAAGNVRNKFRLSTGSGTTTPTDFTVEEDWTGGKK